MKYLKLSFNLILFFAIFTYTQKIHAKLSFAYSSFSESVFYDNVPGSDGIAVLADDTLLIVNEWGDTDIGIFKAVEGESFKEEDLFATTSQISGPDNILYYPDIGIFLSDDAQTVYKFSLNGNTCENFVTTSTTGSSSFDPYGLAIAPDGFDGTNVDPGDIIIADNGYGSSSKAIWAVNPSTGVAKAIVQGAALIDGPLIVSFNSEGTMYVFQNDDSGESRIVTVNPEGNVTEVLSLPNNGNLAIHPVTNDIFHTWGESGYIYRIPFGSNEPEIFASGLEWNQDMQFNEAGNMLYISGNSGEGNKIIKIQGDFTSFPMEAAFTTTPTEGRSPFVVTFSDFTNWQTSSWEWDIFNDGTVDSYNQNMSYTFTDNDTVPVKLTVTNDTGATASIVKNVPITIIEPPKAYATFTKTTPVIDGVIDDIYNTLSYNITRRHDGYIESEADLSGYYKTLWDNENLYLLVDVKDESLNYAEEWEGDNIEVFFDIGFEKSVNSYDGNDYQIRFNYNSNTITGQNLNNLGVSLSNIDFQFAETSEGYILEVQFPWTGFHLSDNLSEKNLGFEVQIGDNDDGTKREALLSWSTDENNAWYNPSVFGIIELSGDSSNQFTCGLDSIHDIEGNWYQTKTIGNQCWMAQNLATTKYNDGTAIPNVTGNSEWADLSTPAYCWYDNDESSYKDTYGALYNWYTVETGKLCPDGWHVPTDDEWKELEMFLGMSQGDADDTGWRGTDEGDKLKSESGWNSSGNGTDDYGFSALPGGDRYHRNGGFYSEGINGDWWSATLDSTDYAWRRDMGYDRSLVGRNNSNKEYGFSVRCLRDAGQTPNQLPAAPNTPQPTDGATALGIDTSLQWSCSDPDGDSLMYDVYFDSTDASTLVSEGQTDSAYATGTLEYSTTYYWKVVAKDGNGNQTTSATWSFTTMADTSSSNTTDSTVTDIDGNTYKTVTIGNQTWMAENLRATIYADGTPIPKVTVNTEWANLGDNNTDKAYCWYDNDSTSYSQTYGALYTYAAATNGDNSGRNVQGVCPDGWHLPSDAEWIELVDYLIANGYNWDGTTFGDKTGKSLAATSGWNSSGDEGAVGNDQQSNNSTGFSALPVGYRSYDDGSFKHAGYYGYWWSSSETHGSKAYYRLLLYNYPFLGRGNGDGKSGGFSVRCLRDGSSQPTNQPPSSPITPQPTDGAIAVGIDTTLQWSCSDPHGDSLTYDVYFDSNDASTLASEGQTDSAYATCTLEYGTTYYWKVVAKDGNGNETSSGIWSFTTMVDTSLTDTIPYGSVTDIDGNIYKTVTIGNQTWMAENLATTKYNDGTDIPIVTGNSEWADLSTPAYCWYDNNESNYKDTYGALYNWYTVETGKLCPDGWHVPTDDEWKELEMFLGMSQNDADNTGWRGTNEGDKLKSESGWNSGGNGTDDYGFSALPGGVRSSVNGDFNDEGGSGYWWSATEDKASDPWRRFMYYLHSDVLRYGSLKEGGISVRCLRDAGQTPNQPPTSPNTPQPTDGATAIGIDTILQWSCSDPDALTYNVYFDSTDASTLVSEGQTDSAYATGKLEYNTTYHWKIIAKDGNGNQTTSATWSFTTMADTGLTDTISYGSLTDIDGNTYQTVTIGNQTWMAENLRATTYADGTPIPKVTGNTEWVNLGDNDTDKAYCWYDNDSISYSQTYGALYTYAAATNGDNSGSNVQGVCPDGWHLPSDAEWTELEDYLIANGYNWDGTTTGDKIGKSLAATSGWNSSDDEGAVGNDQQSNNSTGFSALPGGFRLDDNGSFIYAGIYGYWWSSSEFSDSDPYGRYLVYVYPHLARYIDNKSNGFSVRCLRDSSSQPTSQAPSSPTTPQPFDGATAIGINTTLQWSCSDPEGDSLTYDVYLDSNDATTLASEGQTDSAYATGTLEYSTTYHWKIIAKDGNGNQTTSATWSFTTMDETITEPVKTGILSDIDGNMYKAVKIGSKWWMAENLATTKYNDGTDIPYVTDDTEWSELSSPAYCWYNNDEAQYKDIYGALYNWYTVETGKLCPDGWHVPTDDEWTELEDYLIANGYNWDGTTTDNKIGKSLAATSGWGSSSDEGDVGNDQQSNNSTGFSALPGGYRSRYDGSFNIAGIYGYWWSSSERDGSGAYYRGLRYNYPTLNRNGIVKSYGFSVRCVGNSDSIPEISYIAITLAVDMNLLIEQEEFDSTINFVDVAGSFNEWQGSEPLTDVDNNGIYETTIDSLITGEEIEYIFRINGNWQDAEWQGEPYRAAKVKPDTVINKTWGPEPSNPITDIYLRNHIIPHNIKMKEIISRLRTEQEQSLPPYDFHYSYELVDGEGSQDNMLFAIEGDSLFANSSYDLNLKEDFSIRIRAFDGIENYYEKSFELHLKHSSWERYNGKIQEGIDEIYAIDEDVVWALDQNEEISRTTDGGNNWDTISYFKGGSGSMFALNADTAWFVNSFSPDKELGLYKTMDGGQTWNRHNLDFTFPNFIYFWNENEGFCAGDNYELYTTTNGGEKWDTVKNIPELVDYQINSSQLRYVIGDTIWYSTNYAIYRSPDKGHTWEAFSVGFKYGELAFKNSSEGLRFSFDDNKIYKTSDGGENWSFIDATGYPMYYGIDYDPYNDRYISAGIGPNNDYGISYSYDDGGTWQLDTSFHYLETGLGIDVLNESIIWVGGFNGNIFKYVGEDNIPSSLQITMHPKDEEVLLDDTAMFTVKADKAQSYQWQVSNDNGATFSDLTDSVAYERVSGDTLQILMADCQQNNNLYRCKIENLREAQFSDAAPLKVYAKSSDSAIICEGETYKYHGSEYSKAGIYSDTIISTLGCDSIYSLALTVHDVPQIDLGPDTTLNDTDSLILDAGSFVEYLWQDNSTNRTFKVKGSVYELGDHEFWVQVTGENGCQHSDTIVITIDEGVGYETIALNESGNVKIYPNPAKENLTIEFLNMEANKLVISLVSIEGKTMLNKQFLPKTERFREELDLTGFSPGMYLIKIHSNDRFKTKRLIIE